MSAGGMNRAVQVLGKFPTVRSQMSYLGDMPEPPYMYYVEPPEGTPFTNVIDDQRNVEFADVSSGKGDFTLEADGFAFVQHHHEFSDFYDDARLRADYLPVVEDFFRKALNVEQVAVYDYSIRRPDHGEARPDGIPVQGAFRRPIRRAHGDFALCSGERFGAEIGSRFGFDATGKRYRSYNFWRPIRGPLTDAPLGICHPASVTEADLVPMKQYLGARDNFISALRYNPAHRWLYCKAMEAHEGWVFSSYDSTLPCARGVVTHGAFDDPTCPQDGLPRESIEIRVAVLGG